MTRSRSARTTTATAIKLGELALAVPQVVAHRVGRMATAGTPMSKRDRKEFTGMVAEKQIAFTSAWWGMAAQMGAAQQAMASMWWRAMWSPWFGMGRATPNRLGAGLQDAMLRIFGAGLAPIHGRAVANARRLSRTRRS